MLGQVNPVSSSRRQAAAGRALLAAPPARPPRARPARQVCERHTSCFLSILTFVSGKGEWYATRLKEIAKLSPIPRAPRAPRALRAPAFHQQLPASRAGGSHKRESIQPRVGEWSSTSTSKRSSRTHLAARQQWNSSAAPLPPLHLRHHIAAIEPPLVAQLARPATNPASGLAPRCPLASSVGVSQRSAATTLKGAALRSRLPPLNRRPRLAGAIPARRRQLDSTEQSTPRALAPRLLLPRPRRPPLHEAPMLLLLHRRRTRRLRLPTACALRRTWGQGALTVTRRALQRWAAARITPTESEYRSVGNESALRYNVRHCHPGLVPLVHLVLAGGSDRR